MLRHSKMCTCFIARTGTRPSRVRFKAIRSFDLGLAVMLRRRVSSMSSH